MSQTVKETSFELDVSYPSTCPECLKAGETVSLGFSFKEGGIFCATGKHKFDKVPGEGTTEPEKPKPTERVAAVVEQPAALEPTPEPTVAVQEPARRHVQVTYTRPLAGGDIEVTLRIPDRHAQAVQAEAEVQKQTLAEYLQTWIEYALDNQWGR